MRWIREHAEILMIIAVGLFIGGFIAPGIIRWALDLFGASRTRNVAVVNEEAISTQAFQDRFNDRRSRRQEKRESALTGDDLRSLRRETFRQLVDETLLKQILQREGGTATSEEIRSFFASQPIFRGEDGRVDRRRVSAALQRMSDQERKRMEGTARRQLESQRAARWLRSQVGLSDTETRLILRVGLEEARVHGIFLDPTHYVSDSHVRLYYRENRDEFMAPPRVKLRQIFFQLSDTPTTRQRMQELRGTLQTIRRKLKAGQSFARLARRYSEDESTAKQGGLRGWVTPDDLPDRLASAAFNLEVGTLSNLVKTQQGYYLVYLDSGPVQKPRSLDEVESTLRKRLLNDTHWIQARRNAEHLHGLIGRATSPLQRLQELALTRSHSEGTSHRGGDYGWVPYRFVVPTLHSAAGRWQRELTDGRQILASVSETLFTERSEGLRDPIRTQNGFHLFYVSDFRPARIGLLRPKDLQQLQRLVQLKKQSDYVRTWLDHRRRQANIQVEASRDVVGGTFPWTSQTS